LSSSPTNCVYRCVAFERRGTVRLVRGTTHKRRCSISAVSRNVGQQIGVCRMSLQRACELMAWVLSDNVCQLVNHYVGNGAGHYSLSCTDCFLAKFALEHPRDLIAIDKYKWLNSPVDETDPPERSFLSSRAYISPRKAISTECDLNHIKEFRTFRHSSPLDQENWASEQLREIVTNESRDDSLPPPVGNRSSKSRPVVDEEGTSAATGTVAVANIERSTRPCLNECAKNSGHYRPCVALKKSRSAGANVATKRFDGLAEIAQ